jgi:hypothetical protein
MTSVTCGNELFVELSFLRPVGAFYLWRYFSHGSRRGLDSFAPSGLGWDQPYQVFSLFINPSSFAS